ncbi:MAG: M48 family metalloprotease [Planctomycetales bacterium]|nr:M48 family metalloprotease [Planctomycetales bacterium]
MNDVSVELVARVWAQTLLQTVWQGFVIAGCAALVLRTTALRSAEFRYRVTCIAFAMLPLAAIATCFGIARTQHAARRLTNAVAVDSDAIPAVLATTDARPLHHETPVPASSALRSQTERFACTLWCAGFAICIARLILSATWLQRVYRSSTIPPRCLHTATHRLGEKLELGSLPQLRLATQISSAFAAGLLRHVIVLPAAWVNALPPDVVEAVLAHELAHLRRWDLWINFLQRLVEAVLFFHPAVWWLSGQVRLARELRCDQWATCALDTSPVAYAKALEAASRFVHQGSQFAVAPLGENRMSLLHRVEWILGNRRVCLPHGAWILGIIAAAAPMCLSGVRAEPSPPQASLASPIASDDKPDRLSSPAPSTSPESQSPESQPAPAPALGNAALDKLAADYTAAGLLGDGSQSDDAAEAVIAWFEDESRVEADFTGAPDADEKLFVVTYNVADLVKPLPTSGVNVTSGQLLTMAIEPQIPPDFDSLIDLIVSTVAHDSWMKSGVGQGELQPYPTKLSLVVSQTRSVHQQIADLLAQLRRLQTPTCQLQFTCIAEPAHGVLTRRYGEAKLPQTIPSPELPPLLRELNSAAEGKLAECEKLDCYNGQQVMLLRTMAPEFSHNAISFGWIQCVALGLDQGQSVVRLSLRRGLAAEIGAESVTLREGEAWLIPCGAHSAANNEREFLLVTPHLVTAAK